MAAAMPIFEISTIICHNLPYQYLRDLLEPTQGAHLKLPHIYFRLSATPAQESMEPINQKILKATLQSFSYSLS